MPAFPLNDHWISSPKDSIVEQTFSVGREGAAALGLASSNFSLLHFPNMMEDRGFPEVIFFSFVVLIFLCFFQGGDKLRYHFRDDGFRLWTALKRLILNQKRMHVFCFVFVFYPLKFVGMFMGLSGESTAQMDRLILNIIWCHCGPISFYCHMTNSIYFAVEFIFF